MRLTLLSDSFVSASFDDAGPLVRSGGTPGRADHFAALCRGFAALAALLLPIGLTLAGVAPPVGIESDGPAIGHAPTFARMGF